ncbi:MAG: hypothetical protein HKO53_01315 [Gemmatimonadetes bacterium]|nr:hypothetical protein [Gemmatimonadota bacterium]
MASSPHASRPRRTRGALTLALGLVLATPGLVQAQAHRTAIAVDSLRKIQEIEPRSGPAGSRVTVYTENLPLQGKVVLGVGAINAGFEVLGEADQGALGEVDGSIRIPASATWDRALVLITLNGNFAPTALSDPFHVTSPEGLILRVGQVTDEGEGCLGFRDSDGYFYSLTGSHGDLSVGDYVEMVGRFDPEGGCPLGETLDVTSAKEATPPPPPGG